MTPEQPFLFFLAATGKNCSCVDGSGTKRTNLICTFSCLRKVHQFSFHVSLPGSNKSLPSQVFCLITLSSFLPETASQEKTIKAQQRSILQMLLQQLLLFILKTNLDLYKIENNLCEKKNATRNVPLYSRTLR